MIQGFTAAASEKAAAMIQSNKGYISESLNILWTYGFIISVGPDPCGTKYHTKPHLDS